MAAPKTLRAFAPFVCQSCRRQARPQAARSFATSAKRHAEPDGLSAYFGQADSAREQSTRRRGGTNVASSLLDAFERPAQDIFRDQAGENLDHQPDRPPHRLHVYATKHNTHITLVQPPTSAAQTASSRISGTSASSADQKKQIDVLMSISAGNIGFRKAGRGSYDAAYQLAAYALKQIQERKMLHQVGPGKLEVVLRGFGAGREAVTKALLGVEGRNVRGLIGGVKDATRLKQGGPRSKKPRRLG